jgi:CubicO group peptidase (beta-lactamase class C family)
LGYDVLGLVIEKVAGQSFEDYVKHNILNPAGMTKSDFRYFNIADSLKTSPHSKNRITKQVYELSVYPYTREHAPSSTLNSSVSDLSGWMLSFMDKLSTEKSPFILRAMTEPSTDLNSHIGLGFQLYTIEGMPAIGHFGGDTGFRSYLVMFPREDIGVVVLINCDYNEDVRQEIVHPIVKLIK